MKREMIERLLADDRATETLPARWITFTILAGLMALMLLLEFVL